VGRRGTGNVVMALGVAHKVNDLFVFVVPLNGVESLQGNRAFDHRHPYIRPLSAEARYHHYGIRF